MPGAELNPEARKLLRRMTGRPGDATVAEEPVDFSKIDALALGDLWAVAHATCRSEERGRIGSVAGDTARQVRQLGCKTPPVFRAASCRDFLDLLAGEAAATPDSTRDIVLGSAWRNAAFALVHCSDPSPDVLGPAARRFLAMAERGVLPHFVVVLARLARADQWLERLAEDHADSPLLVDELRAAAGLDLAANIAVADVAHPDYLLGEPAGPEAPYRLSRYAAYAAFAEAGLKRALERLRRIHAREIAYAADKAFSIEEGAVIGRLARVALDRDELWLPPVLDELLRKTSVAPTAAKTLPSQSVAIALAHAIEAFPTPEAVTSLRKVVKEVRHAGVKKKLQRDLRGAELGLARRPEVALRLPSGEPVSKAQLTTLARSLEACLALGVALPWEGWRARLAEPLAARELTGALVWRLLDPGGGAIAVLPGRDGVTLGDISGSEVAPAPGARMTLWHPADVTPEEAEAWRDRIAVLQIRQPFKQVFREHYTVPAEELPDTATVMFAGHIVSLVPLLGLARRESWKIDEDCLVRSFGPWTARLELADPVHPGCTGATTTRSVSVRMSDGAKSRPVRLGDLPRATRSEILRAVDLLVSTSGFALSEEDERRHDDVHLQRLALRPLGAMAEMRKRALERALRGLPGMERLQFDARHLRLGGYAIHLATGRVTRDGEPVMVEVPKRPALALSWLPYDEKLLETIHATAIEVARRLAEERPAPGA